MILAGDIGGTKTVLALFRNFSGELQLVKEKKFESQHYFQFKDILPEFFESGNKQTIDSVCLGVAGPVQEGRSQTTNLPWFLDEKEISESLGVKKVKLLNDLEATAYGVLFLSPKDMAILNKGRKRIGKGNIAVIAAGTGLGEAFLYWDGKNYHPLPSEGGHSDFAPRSDIEIELLRFLSLQFGHVSYERLLSGPGIFNIYSFLRESGFSKEPEWMSEKLTKGDPSATITQMALEKGDPLCQKTLDLFCSIYGAEAGNMALKMFTMGGVFVGGGIAPKILKKLKEGVFMRGFLKKGRYEQFLKEIPVKIILNPRLALMGAGHFALNHLSD